MAGPITNDYISATCKSFVSNDNDGKMIEKNFIEIEESFLVKIRDNTFNRIDGENVFEHINSFLEVVEPLKVRGLSHDRFRLSVFPMSLSGAASKCFTNECIGTISTWDDLVEKFVQKFYNLFDHNEEEEAEDDDDPNMIDNVPEIFKIEDDLFNFDTPLCTITTLDHICEPSASKMKLQNGQLEFRNDGYCNGGELPGMVRVGHMTNFQDHKCFKNFHELDYDVLVKLEECWWKVNTDEVCPFTRWDNRLRGPYANAKPKWTFDPYLNINRKPEKNNETNNCGNIQEGQRCMEDLTHEPSAFKIRRLRNDKIHV
ncbi:hypothetical protein Tco_1533836 [Tanacetum coccineum]